MATQPKPTKKPSPDTLAQPTKKPDIELKEDELKEEELKRVTGGFKISYKL